MSGRFSSFGAFSGLFADLVVLIKNNDKKELAKFLPIKVTTSIAIKDVNDKIASLIEDVINPLYFEKTANIKKEYFEDNLYYCYEDFLTSLKAVKRKYSEKYSTSDAIDDFKKAVKKLIKKLEKITSWTIGIDSYEFTELDKIIQRTEIHIKSLKIARKEGRHAKPFNIFFYNLLNKFSVYKRDEKRNLLYDRNGIIKIKKDWNLIFYLLFWIHFHKQKFEEVEKLIEKYNNESASDALRGIRKNLQRRYSHFESMTGQWKIFGTNVKKVIITDNGYKIIDL